MTAGPTRRNTLPRGDAADSSRRPRNRPGSDTSNTIDADGPNTIEVDGRIVDLRNRSLAALLAWAVPGWGHFYQGRRTKAAIFFVVIMATWLSGFLIGGGNVVYASWQPGDRRWQFIPQAAVGLAAVPALIEGKRMNDYTDRRTGRTVAGYRPLFGGPMAPPYRPVGETTADQVADWYAARGAGYEMGTWYTIIAGLLNVLVIYDAFGGPSNTPISGPKRSRRRDAADEDPDGDPDAANAPTEDRGKPATTIGT